MSSLLGTILIVDDEKNTRLGLQRFLESKDYDVCLADGGKEALRAIDEAKPDLALIDLKMPDMDGMTLLYRLKADHPEVVTIMLTAYGTVETAVTAMQAGAYHYLMKPVNLDELDIVIQKAFHGRALEQENKNLRQELLAEKYDSFDIIGRSVPIRKLLKEAEQIADSSASVLIEGESGTGKEMVAHLIHQLSRRKEKPFVTVHCAALTDSLLASELFGHERGAFTGAYERKTGRFERADKGTLFLDEIGEIPHATQVTLLRVLQDGEFERVGGTKPIHADVRLICSTNKDLHHEVEKGNFREDLYYRINVICLKLPPLRDRASDIPLLLTHYLQYFARKNQKSVKAINDEAVTLLCRYAWPGNIRELRNVVERLVVLAKNPVVEAIDLPIDIRTEKISDTQAKPLLVSKAMNLSDIEKNAISQTLKTCRGNKSATAKKLGISRRTLYRKLRDYHLDV